MTTKELKAMQPINSGIQSLILLLFMLLEFVAFGVLIALLRTHHVLWTVLMAVLMLFVVINTGIFGFWHIFKQETAMQKVFTDEDILVEQDGDKPLRIIEQLAVDRFGGNLKQALEFAATSPELSRMERYNIDKQLRPYENVYVRNKCGTLLRGVTLNDSIESRRNVLNRAQIETDLAKVSRKYRKDPCPYEVTRTICVQKRLAHTLESGYAYLRFDEGLYDCPTDIYFLAAEGDPFFVVRLQGENRILLAYSERDWVAAEDLPM